ncbi:MAG TPA: hypothetical protein VFT74_04745 [Isosphaeraceae bacterium]|nr:hypothetical protein [Isosphaeraceae bacterium]
MTPNPPDPLSLDPDQFREPLKALYSELDSEIAALAPQCDLSGRCCRFQEFDHTLFLSTVEASFLLADAPEPSRVLDSGATCPWQNDRGLCTAREARPLGCRVFFCDPVYQEPGRDLAERAIQTLKKLVDSLDLPWNYAPLHYHLHAAASSKDLSKTR